jgi:hypothetical protein
MALENVKGQDYPQDAAIDPLLSAEIFTYQG